MIRIEIDPFEIQGAGNSRQFIVEKLMEAGATSKKGHATYFYDESLNKIVAEWYDDDE